VDHSTTLAADLQRLVEHLNSHGEGLERSLARTTRTLQEAVASYLGLVLSFQIDGQPIVLTSTEDSAARPVGASLWMPLAVILGPGSPGRLELYAAAPGAFVDLAADLQYALGLNENVIQLDQRLGLTLAPSSLTGVDDFSTINRAIGVLIEDGHTPSRALDQLQTRARSTGFALTVVARMLLDDRLD
jgi:hypothetical protein